jgi:hypothetical protein
MRRIDLVIILTAFASAIAFPGSAFAEFRECRHSFLGEVCNLKAGFDRCESLFADDPQRLAICKLRLATDADTPLQMGGRLNQIENSRKTRRQRISKNARTANAGFRPAGLKRWQSYALSKAVSCVRKNSTNDANPLSM